MNKDNRVEMQAALQNAVRKVPLDQQQQPTQTSDSDQLQNQQQQQQQSFEGDKLSAAEFHRLKDHRMALWRTEEFKQSLRKVVKEQLKKEKNHVPNKYASRVYKEMYFNSVVSSDRFKIYEKVMLHPECTKADYYYIDDKIKHIDTNIQISTGITLGTLVYLTVKKDFLQKVMKSPAVMIPLVGIMPLIGMQAAKFFTELSIQKDLQKKGLFVKYQIDIGDESIIR